MHLRIKRKSVDKDSQLVLFDLVYPNTVSIGPKIRIEPDSDCSNFSLNTLNGLFRHRFITSCVLHGRNAFECLLRGDLILSLSLSLFFYLSTYREKWKPVINFRVILQQFNTNGV